MYAERLDIQSYNIVWLDIQSFNIVGLWPLSHAASLEHTTLTETRGRTDQRGIPIAEHTHMRQKQAIPNKHTSTQKKAERNRPMPIIAGGGST